MNELAKLDGYTIAETLEIALQKARGQPIQDEVSLQSLLLRVKERLNEKWLSSQREMLFVPSPSYLEVKYTPSCTDNAKIVEELLNLDRMTGGLPPLLFGGRLPSALPNFKRS